MRKQPFPWDEDDELKNLLEERKQYHIKNEKIRYRTIQKRIRKRVTVLRNKHYANKAKKFSEAQIARDIAKAYKIAKEQLKIHRKKPRQLDCPGLLDHFRKHFNPNQLDAPDPPSLPKPREQALDINDQPPTMEEISKAIKKL